MCSSSEFFEGRLSPDMGHNLFVIVLWPKDACLLINLCDQLCVKLLIFIVCRTCSFKCMLLFTYHLCKKLPCEEILLTWKTQNCVSRNSLSLDDKNGCKRHLQDIKVDNMSFLWYWPTVVLTWTNFF